MIRARSSRAPFPLKQTNPLPLIRVGAVKIKQVKTASDGHDDPPLLSRGGFSPQVRDDGIVGGIWSRRNIVLWQIGKNQQQVPLFLFEERRLLSKRLHFRGLRANLRFDRGRVTTLRAQALRFPRLSRFLSACRPCSRVSTSRRLESDASTASTASSISEPRVARRAFTRSGLSRRRRISSMA